MEKDTDTPCTPINTIELLKKPYLTETETAALTGRALSTLRNERFLRRGFPYLRIGKRSIRYLTSDIVQAMEGRRITFEDARGPGRHPAKDSEPTGVTVGG